MFKHDGWKLYGPIFVIEDSCGRKMLSPRTNPRKKRDLGNEQVVIEFTSFCKGLEISGTSYICAHNR